MYHRICWENTYTDIPDDVLDEEDLRLIENGSIPVSSFVPITTSAISTNTIPTNTITFAVRGSAYGEPITQ
jgi:hypothetical protein